MLLNYNIPLWLTMKKFCIMLALLILRKQSVTLQFFNGIIGWRFDAIMEGCGCLWHAQRAGIKGFQTKSSVTMDHPRFSRLWDCCSCCTLRLCGVSVCGLHFKGEHSVELGKQTYTNTRRWLAHDDPSRLLEKKNHFNGRIEEWGKSNGVTTDEQV